jgi:hypothetical protein
MVITDILKRINTVRDRIKELEGEAITLNAKHECEQIDPLLYHMKFDCIEYERFLMKKELEEIEAEVQVDLLLKESFGN